VRIHRPLSGDPFTLSERPEHRDEVVRGVPGLGCRENDRLVVAFWAGQRQLREVVGGHALPGLVALAELPGDELLGLVLRALAQHDAGEAHQVERAKELHVREPRRAPQQDRTSNSGPVRPLSIRHVLLDSADEPGVDVPAEIRLRAGMSPSGRSSGSAVSAHLAGISNHVVGVILMIVGVLALGIGLVQSFAAGSASQPAKPTVRATRSPGRSRRMPPA
jgi:hypothetical protein